jgi:hypothetical protein
MAAGYVFSPKEPPDAARLLQGECVNMRQVLTDYPDSIFEFKAHYPQHPASSYDGAALKDAIPPAIFSSLDRTHAVRELRLLHRVA